MDTAKIESSRATNTTLMKQRMHWALLTTLSRNCTVTKVNNTAHTGIIHTFCKKGVILLAKSPNSPTRTKIPFDEIISLECPNLQIGSKSKFKTDQDISKRSKLQKRDLQQWDGEDASSLSFDIKDYKSWDQFETNAQKFGVISTYDENLYTTPVPHISELTEEQLHRARAVEKELIGKSMDKEEDEDEEAMFGAVLGSGRYTNVNRSNSRNSSDKNNEKETYRRMGKGVETAKKGEEGKIITGDSVESLKLILPKVEGNEKVQRSFRVVKNTVQSPTATLNSLKDFSKETSPNPSPLPQVNLTHNSTKFCKARSETAEKCGSIIDLFISSWHKLSHPDSL